MFNFVELEKKYYNDPAFNQMVTCFRRLLDEYGFMPSEIREGLFYAQYTFEMFRAETQLKTQKQWEDIAKMRELLRATFVSDEANAHKAEVSE